MAIVGAHTLHEHTRLVSPRISRLRFGPFLLERVVLDGLLHNPIRDDQKQWCADPWRGSEQAWSFHCISRACPQEDHPTLPFFP